MLIIVMFQEVLKVNANDIVSALSFGQIRIYPHKVPRAVHNWVSKMFNMNNVIIIFTIMPALWKTDRDGGICWLCGSQTEMGAAAGCVEDRQRWRQLLAVWKTDRDGGSC